MSGVEAGIGNMGSAALSFLNQPLVDQNPQRLANGLTADLILLAELDFCGQLPGIMKCAALNQSAQCISQLYIFGRHEEHRPLICTGIIIAWDKSKVNESTNFNGKIKNSLLIRTTCKKQGERTRGEAKNSKKKGGGKFSEGNYAKRNGLVPMEFRQNDEEN